MCRYTGLNEAQKRSTKRTTLIGNNRLFSYHAPRWGSGKKINAKRGKDGNKEEKEMSNQGRTAKCPENCTASFQSSVISPLFVTLIFRL